MNQTIRPFSEQGNFTQMHNVVFDEIMPHVSANAFKVLCLIVRRTKGFQKRSDAISYADIKGGTGIKSDATVSSSLKELLEFGCIVRKDGEGQFAPTLYALNRSFKITTSKNEVTSFFEVVETEPPTSKNEVVATSKIEEQPTSKNEEYCIKEITLKKEKESTLLASLEKPTEKAASTSLQICKPDAPETEPLRTAIFAACNIDTTSPLTTKVERIQVANAAKAFHAAGVPPEQITQVRELWDLHDWRGLRGDPPKPTELQKEFRNLLKKSENPNGQNYAPKLTAANAANDIGTRDFIRKHGINF